MGPGQGGLGFAEGVAIEATAKAQSKGSFNGFGCSDALSGCLLPGSGGLPARTHRRRPAPRSGPAQRAGRSRDPRGNAAQAGHAHPWPAVRNTPPGRRIGDSLTWFCGTTASGLRGPAFPRLPRSSGAPAGCPDHQANIVERLIGIPGRRWPRNGKQRLDLSARKQGLVDQPAITCCLPSRQNAALPAH
jgi:hypothetical protein